MKTQCNCVGIKKGLKIFNPETRIMSVKFYLSFNIEIVSPLKQMSNKDAHYSIK